MVNVRPRVLAAALGGALTVEAVLLAVLLRHNQLSHYSYAQLLVATSGPVWAVAVLLFSRLRMSGRNAALLVLGVGAVLQLIALTHWPTTSDDDYRYVWDAKVQFAGIDPYSYSPSSPALAQLREPFLFGPPAHCTYHFASGCTSINRPTVHTIYPPVAEVAFDAIRLGSLGGRGGHLPLQLAGALGSLAVAWLLLHRSRDRPWRAALWAWCPIVVIEYGNNAHIDWLGVLLVVLAFGARRTGAVGALVGAAIAIKLYPALVLPALMRRSWWTAVAAIGFVVLVYIPHVIAVGSAVIGYLPGYLHEEDYGSGNRLLLLHGVLPHPADTIVGAILVIAVGLWAWRFGSVSAPERCAVLVVGVAFLVFTPNFGWYSGLLLALVALTGALEWVPIVFAPTFAYLVHSDHDTGIFVIAASLTAALAVLRHTDNLRACLRLISSSTDRSPSSPSTPRR